MRTQHMTEKQRRKAVKKAAMEVCWGISIAANFGFTKEQMVDDMWPDFIKWADLVDWENYR